MRKVLTLSVILFASVVLAAPAPVPKRRSPEIVPGTYLMQWAAWPDCELILYEDGTYEHSFMNRNWRMMYHGAWTWDSRRRILTFHETSNNWINTRDFRCALKKDSLTNLAEVPHGFTEIVLTPEHFERGIH